MTTATTSAVAAPIATIFAINDGFVLPALEGLTQDELWKAPTDRNNAMLWIAGHVVQTRATILQLLGEPLTPAGESCSTAVPLPPTVADADRYPSRDRHCEGHARDHSAASREARVARRHVSGRTGPHAGAWHQTRWPTSSRSSRSTSPITLDSWRTFRKGLGYPGLAG